MLTSFLDMVGVILLGVVGVLLVATVEGQRPPRRVQEAVVAAGFSDWSDTKLVAALVSTAAILLLAKSVVSPLLMARLFIFLTRREAEVSANLTRQLLAQPLTFVQERSSQETGTALIQGAGSAVTVVLGQMVVVVSETALLCALAVILLVANPLLAVCAVIFFAGVALILQRVLGRRAARFGAAQTDSNVSSLRVVQEALGVYREITVFNRRAFYADRIHQLRHQGAQSAAGLQIVNMLPKYVSEGALVLGAFALAGILFATQPAAAAAGTFALFLATATRVMPSLLRLQSAALYLRSAGGAAAFTYSLADALAKLDGVTNQTRNETYRGGVDPKCVTNFSPTIAIRNVNFTYPGCETPALRDINLECSEGQSIALVGRSGSGKSTLADLILGVISPERGTVTVADVHPVDAVRLWPGAIAYVPQDVMVSDESIRQNIALGLPLSLIDDAMVWNALRRAQLEDYVRSQPTGLDTQVGERGLRLSGGQRQRLGVARALYTLPKLLVLDEATSALDAETEQAVSHMLQSLSSDITTIVIAHRLSTIRHVDLVVYLEDGCLVEHGTFDEVCARIPALERQAELMGLRGKSPGVL